MMIYGNGYLTFAGIECVYFESSEGIKILPKESANVYELLRHVDDRDFLIKFTRNVDTNCLARIERVITDHMSSITLVPKYLIDMFCDEPISYLEITGTAIDEFFSSSFYLFDKSGLDSEGNNNLLQDDAVADRWSIEVQDVPVVIELKFGGLLRHGTLSEPLFRPRLKVYIEKSCDPDFIDTICNIISRFLQLVQYRRSLRAYKISCHSGPPTHNSGMYWKWETIELSEIKEYSRANYRYYKPYIHCLLQFTANNLDVSLRFLPTKYRWQGKDYTPEDLSSLFAAFESEYKELCKMHEVSNSPNYDKIKSKVISSIRNCDDMSLSKEERDYIRLSIEKVKGIGSQVGQKQKIKNMYSLLEPAIKSSVAYFFGSRADDELHMDVGTIAKEIVGLRSQVSHEYTISTFTDQQARFIRLLEIIVYAQILRRAGIDNDGIEMIIGLTFGTNSAFWKTIRR